jgi:ABC-2 type transport system permease protein
MTIALGLAGLIFWFALVTSERLYYSGWASLQGTARKKKAPRAARGPAIPAARQAEELGRRYIPAPVRAVVVKDFFVLRRDLRNMSQLVTPLIFGIVYAVAFLRGGPDSFAGRGDAPDWFMTIANNAYIYGNVGLSLFVGWMLLARLAGVGFSQEGKSYWLLKTAPVSVNQLLAAKFLVAYLPTLALGWLFLLAITLVQRANPGMLVYTLPVVALNIAGNAGLNLAFGVVGANMSWEDPRHMHRGSTGCLGMIASILYLPFSLGLFFGPPILAAALEWPVAVGWLFGLAIGGIFSLACAIVPLALVRQRVPRLGEE